MSAKTSLNKGDFVKDNSDGSAKVGVVVNREFEFEDQQYYSVAVSPNDTEGQELPESALAKLETPDEQREAVEQETKQNILEVVLRLKEILEKTHWALAQINAQELTSSSRESQEKTIPTLQQIDEDDSSLNISYSPALVVVGIYAGHGEYRPHMTAVKAFPETTEEEVNEALFLNYPNGFENIPGVLPGTKHSKLLGYRTYRIPWASAKLINWKIESGLKDKGDKISFGYNPKEHIIR